MLGKEKVSHLHLVTLKFYRITGKSAYEALKWLILVGLRLTAKGFRLTLCKNEMRQGKFQKAMRCQCAVQDIIHRDLMAQMLLDSGFQHENVSLLDLTFQPHHVHRCAYGFCDKKEKPWQNFKVKLSINKFFFRKTKLAPFYSS